MVADADVNYQILVIDDDRDVRNVFCRILKCKNYTIKSACNKKEMLMMIDEFDTRREIITVVDYVLDDATGYDIVVELLERNIKCKNICVTGSHVADNMLAEYERQSLCPDSAGLFHRFLRKPVEGDVLRECVLRLINSSYIPRV